jgi:hypothetical protein
VRRAATYHAALAEFEAATKPLLGTISYYIGPNARVGVSSETVDAYRRLATASAEAWRLLSPDGVSCTCSRHTYDPDVEHLDYCERRGAA